MKKLKAYVVMFKQNTAGYPEIKIFRRRYDAETYLTDNNFYEESDGQWLHPSSMYEARIEKFDF